MPGFCQGNLVVRAFQGLGIQGLGFMVEGFRV